MPSQAATKLVHLMIMQNSPAGTHLLHLLKRLSMLLRYLGILSNILWKNVLMTCLFRIFTAKTVLQTSTTFQSYGGICFQKSSLNQMRYHHTSKPLHDLYAEVHY